MILHTLVLRMVLRDYEDRPRIHSTEPLTYGHCPKGASPASGKKESIVIWKQCWAKNPDAEWGFVIKNEWAPV